MIPFQGQALIFTISAIALIPLHVVEPLLAKQLMDLALGNATPTSSIARFTIAWFLVYSSTALLQLANRVLSTSLEWNIVGRVRTALYEKLIRLPMSYFDLNSVGYIVSRQTDDADNLEGLMYDFVLNVALAAIELLAIFAILLSLNRPLAFLSLLLVILSIRSQFLFPLNDLYRHHNEARAGLSSELHQTITGVSLVKSSSYLEAQLSRYSEAVVRFVRTRIARERANNKRSALSKIFSDVATPLVAIVGAWLLIDNQITVGVLIAFTLYQRRLFANTAPLVGAYPLFTYAKAAYERIFEILDMNDEGTNDCTLGAVLPRHGGVEFRNVSFSYGEEGQTLDNVSFAIQDGQTVALVGPSGSGKSTIVKLLLGLYQPQSGDILLYGQSTRRWPLPALRRFMGYVPQDPFLFNDSIAYNIAYGNPKAQRGEIEAAAALAEAHDFITRLPAGYDTVLGDRGLTMSGGERQRVCIAREILRDAPIIIFDEATSALDSISESQVQRVIAQFKGKKTCFIVSHRLSSIKDADTILVFEDGCLKEVGTHDGLLTKGGVYSSLQARQLQPNSA